MRIKKDIIMNIVAFVLGLLMIFAITTNRLLKKHISDGFVQKSFSGYMCSSRKAMNEYEKYYFDSIKESSKSKGKNEPKNENKIASNTQEEKRQVHPDRAKINIYQLVQEKKENQKELYNVIASLIKELYSNQTFYKQDLEHKILNNILSAFDSQINNKQELSFETLIIADNSLKNTYYKIIKGTKFYDFEKKTGCPSFLDFVKIENTNMKIPMKNASKELLIALFDSDIANKIYELQTQKNKLKELTYQNILSLCQKNYCSFDEKILKLFDFTNSKTRSTEKIFVGFDKKTDIKCKIKHPIS